MAKNNNGGYIDVLDFTPDAGGGIPFKLPKKFSKLANFIIPKRRPEELPVQTEPQSEPQPEQQPKPQSAEQQPEPQLEPQPAELENNTHAKLTECTSKLDNVTKQLKYNKLDINSLLIKNNNLQSTYEILIREKEEYNNTLRFINNWILPPYITIGIILLIFNIYYTYLHTKYYRKIEKLEYKYNMRKLSTEYTIIILYILPILGYSMYYKKYIYMLIILFIIVAKFSAIGAGFASNKHNVDKKYFFNF